MPAFIANRNWLDEPGVTLAASSAVPSLPVANLLTRTRAEVRRTNGTPSAVLNVDLGALRQVRVVLLVAPREGLLPEGGRLARPAQSLGVLTESGNRLVDGTGAPESGAIIEARLSAGSAGGSDAGLVRAPYAMPLGYWCWMLPAAVGARHLRLALTGSARPYAQAGRLWICDGIAPAIGLSSEGFEDGLEEVRPGQTLRRVQFTLPWIGEAESADLRTMFLVTGTGREILVIPEDERLDQVIVGRFSAPPAFRATEMPDLFSVSITVREDR